MNYLKLLLCTLMVLPFANFAMQFQDDENLRKKYQAPPELAQILDTAYEKNETFRECLKYMAVCKCPNNLPCYIKSNHVMQRIRNLDKLQTLFSTEKLHDLMLPQKYVWRNYLVAEELAPEKNASGEYTLDGIKKKHLAQLIVLSKKGGFLDFIGSEWPFGTPNIYFSKDRPGKKFWQSDFISRNYDNPKKIAVIDTKRFSFDENDFSTSQLCQLLEKNNHEKCKNQISWWSLHTSVNQNKFDAFWNRWKHCFKEQKEK